MSPRCINERTIKTQRDSLLQALQHGPVTTIQARDLLGIASPAPRIMELRRAGHVILTEKATACLDHAGRPHTVARYRLCLPLLNKGGAA